MKDDFLKNMVDAQMMTYKTAFDEGRKIGFSEGYLKGVTECKKIVDNTLGTKQ